jgi:hypothetical protein
MSLVASRSVQSVISELTAQHLQLAPEGWRQCVEKIAEGYAEVVGRHLYCLNCDGVLQGAQGHDVNCVTMVARRLLANEPLLHAHLALGSLYGVGHGHRAKPFSKSGRRIDRQYSKPRMWPRRLDAQYVVPTFLQIALPGRKS